MHRSFTFNGTRKDWLYLLRGRQESPYAPINHTMNRVPGMAGAHVASTETDVLYVSQPIGFKVENEEHEQNLLDELKEWLITVDDVEIQFDNVPGKTYIGRITASMNDYNRQGNLRSGTLVFLCSPYKYGEEKAHSLTSQVGNIINVEGTAETKPIFELDVTAPITYAMIQNHLNEYMMIGQPIDVESQVPFQKYERVLSDPMSSLVGWSDASSSDIDGGVIAGNIISQNGRFIAESYGTGTSWHGPGKKRGLTVPLKDFRLEVELDFFNNLIAHVGRVEVYLLDVLGNQVAKVALKDTKSGSMDAVGEVRAGGSGGHFLVDSTNSNSWNDFNGVLRIEREGNKWRAYVARIRNGKHTGRLNVEWTDRQGLYTANVAQVVVHLGQIGTYIVPDQGLKHITIDKINQEPEGVPYIADVGDKITFDFQNRELLINGENRKDLKTDLGGRYFTFKPGQNTIALSPNAISGISKYRPAYK